MINKGVDINQVNLNNGTTALHWAVYGKSLKMVQILVDAGKIFPCKKI
jgi:ankyrin repeat protein